MPTYEFICNACRQRFDVFLTYAQYGKTPIHCAHCNSGDVRRRMSKVRIAKAEERRLESMADELSGLDELANDPKALGQVMKKLGKEMGEDTPAEFNEVVDRLSAGQSPDEIESALPNLDGDE